jgi:hypothetical protein
LALVGRKGALFTEWGSRGEIDEVTFLPGFAKNRRSGDEDMEG